MRLRGVAVHFRFGSLGYPEPAEDYSLLADSIETILKTYPGERPHRPAFGSFLKRIVFANMDQGSTYRAAAEVRRAVSLWEKRVIIDDIRFKTEDERINLLVIWRPVPGNTQAQSTVLGF